MEDQNIKTYKQNLKPSADGSVSGFKVGNLIIKIDRSKCISCGTCSALAPNTFEMDSDLIAKIKDHGPYDNEETIKSAQASCSGGAITIEVMQEAPREDVPQVPEAGKPDFRQPQ